MKIFAAIDVGSFEVSMKIFQFVSGKMKELDHVRYGISLGTDTYLSGKLSNEHVSELCDVLQSFVQIMESYQVTEYKAYGTSAFREMDNELIVCDLIHQRTGILIDQLSNSEQRYLDYKAVAAKGEIFHTIIKQSTAIVDISGGSLQISLFDKESIVATQRLQLGLLRLQDMLRLIDANEGNQYAYIEELANAQLSVFRKLHLKDKEVLNIIVIDDFLAPYMSRYSKHNFGQGFWSVEELQVFFQQVNGKSIMDCANFLGETEEISKKIVLSLQLLQSIVKTLHSSLVWGVMATLCDGIAYEYGEDNKLFHLTHDFEKDIVGCAQNISKRYMGSKKRSETLEKISLSIFDSMKKIHGLGKRERLLLHLASILHDCGKYISIMNMGECGYNIIMSTEIIGLNHQEREVLANVVRFNHDEFVYFDQLKSSSLTKENYFIIAKLTAILRVANSLDRSHKQKFKEIKCQLKEDHLVISVRSDVDIVLERALMVNRAKFFEEVYSIKVQVKQRKIY